MNGPELDLGGDLIWNHSKLDGLSPISVLRRNTVFITPYRPGCPGLPLMVPPSPSPTPQPALLLEITAGPRIHGRHSGWLAGWLLLHSLSPTDTTMDG